MKRLGFGSVLLGAFWMLALTATGIAAETEQDACIACHLKVPPAAAS